MMTNDHRKKTKERMDTQMSGKVKWYNARVGYGFISGDDGNEYFAHYSRIADGGKHPKLKSGSNVTFEVAQTAEGRQCADNIKTVA
jgi:CspA family cold shock protein